MTSRVKQLLLAEGITVTPSANTMSQAGSYAGFADDSAYVTAKGSAAANRDVYYNTTSSLIREYKGGVWINDLDVSSTQAVTNKDYDGGTASNTSRITVPKNTTTNLNGLTRKEATLVYDTTTSEMKVDNGSTLLPLGGGGGGISSVYLDDTDDGANLSEGFRYIVDMSSASASIELNAPAGTSGDYFEVITTGIEEQTLHPDTVYSVDVLKNGSDVFRLDGTSYTTGITIGTNSDHVGFAWDTGSPWWVTSALTSFVARTLAGDWEVDGKLGAGITPDSGTYDFQSKYTKLGYGFSAGNNVKTTIMDRDTVGKDYWSAIIAITVINPANTGRGATAMYQVYVDTSNPNSAGVARQWSNVNNAGWTWAENTTGTDLSPTEIGLIVTYSTGAWTVEFHQYSNESDVHITCSILASSTSP